MDIDGGGTIAPKIADGVAMKCEESETGGRSGVGVFIFGST